MIVVDCKPDLLFMTEAADNWVPLPETAHVYESVYLELRDMIFPEILNGLGHFIGWHIQLAEHS